MILAACLCKLWVFFKEVKRDVCVVSASGISATHWDPRWLIRGWSMCWSAIKVPKSTGKHEFLSPILEVSCRSSLKLNLICWTYLCIYIYINYSIYISSSSSSRNFILCLFCDSPDGYNAICSATMCTCVHLFLSYVGTFKFTNKMRLENKKGNMPKLLLKDILMFDLVHW